MAITPAGLSQTYCLWNCWCSNSAAVSSQTNRSSSNPGSRSAAAEPRLLWRSAKQKPVPTSLNLPQSCLPTTGLPRSPGSILQSPLNWRKLSNWLRWRSPRTRRLVRWSLPYCHLQRTGVPADSFWSVGWGSEGSPVFRASRHKVVRTFSPSQENSRRDRSQHANTAAAAPPRRPQLTASGR